MSTGPPIGRLWPIQSAPQYDECSPIPQSQIWASTNLGSSSRKKWIWKWIKMNMNECFDALRWTKRLKACFSIEMFIEFPSRRPMVNFPPQTGLGPCICKGSSPAASAPSLHVLHSTTPLRALLAQVHPSKAFGWSLVRGGTRNHCQNASLTPKGQSQKLPRVLPIAARGSPSGAENLNDSKCI